MLNLVLVRAELPWRRGSWVEEEVFGLVPSFCFILVYKLINIETKIKF
jgi:hypothetical protein